MTVRWVEGGEIGTQDAYYTGKYQNRPTSVTVTTPGRVFGHYVQGTVLITPPLATSPIDEWVVGIGWYTGANPDPDTDFIAFFNGGLEQLSLHQLADRTLEVRRGATVLATGTTALPSLDWAYLEFKALLHPSAGSYEVRIDRVTEMSDSGVNTSLSAVNDADVVKFASNSNNRWDDIYVLDTDGGSDNDFLGPRVVEGLSVVGDGDTQEWTPSTAADHYTLVDDANASFSAADYVESATVGQDELFTMTQLEHITGDINAVAVVAVCGMEGVASRTFRSKFRSSTDAEGNGPTVTIDTTATAAPKNIMGIMEQDPSGTPDRWTVEDINQGQFGVEIVS